MKEYAQQRKRSASQHTGPSGRQSVPDIPNSARMSMAAPARQDESVFAEDLREKFQQPQLPSVQREQAQPGAVNPAPAKAKKPGNWFTRGVAKIWDWSIGSMRRSHRRAFEDIMSHKTDRTDPDTGKHDGSYYQIGKLNRALNFINNPLAVASSWFTNKKKWAERKAARDSREQQEIEAYKNTLGPAGSLYDSKRWEIRKKDPGLPKEDANENPLDQAFLMDEGEKLEAEPDAEQNENPLDQAFLLDEGEKLGDQPKEKQQEKPKIVGDPNYDLLLTEPLYNPVSLMPYLLDEKGHLGAKSETENYTAFGIGPEANMGMNLMNTIQGVRGLSKTKKNVETAFKGGLTADKVKSSFGVLGSIGKLITGIGKTMKSVAKFNWFSESVNDKLNWMDKPGGKLFGKDLKAANILALANDGVKMVQSGTDFIGGIRTHSKLGNVNKEIGALDPGEDRTRLGKLSHQAGRSASQRIIDGTLGVVSSGLNAGSTLTKGIFSPILKTTRYGVDKIGGLLSAGHQKSMNIDLLNDEMGLESAIDQYAERMAQKPVDKLGTLEYRNLRKQAKHIILKAHGFQSGKRSEAAAFFNAQRAKYLAQHANSGAKEDKVVSTAQSLVKAMGVGRSGKDKTYNEGEIARRLGRGVDQKKALASRGSMIEGLASRGKGFWNGAKRLGKWLIGM